MEDNDKQPWTLIAIAALGLVLGAIALIVSFDAKNASEDAAAQKSVDQVSTELSNLIDRLGIAEASLTGEQKALQGKAKQEARESRDAVSGVSKRLDRLERQIATLEASAKQTAGLSKEVGSLSTQVESLDSRVATLNQRVTKLSKRVNPVSTGSDGGQASPTSP